MLIMTSVLPPLQMMPVYDLSHGSLEVQVAKAVPIKFALNVLAHVTAHSLLVCHFFQHKRALIMLIAIHSPVPVAPIAPYAHPMASSKAQRSLTLI